MLNCKNFLAIFFAWLNTMSWGFVGRVQRCPNRTLIKISEAPESRDWISWRRTASFWTSLFLDFQSLEAPIDTFSWIQSDGCPRVPAKVEDKSDKGEPERYWNMTVRVKVGTQELYTVIVSIWLHYFIVPNSQVFFYPTLTKIPVETVV